MSSTGSMRVFVLNETLDYNDGGSLAAEFFFSSRRRHTRFDCDWSSDVCSSDLRHEHPPTDDTERRCDSVRNAEQRRGVLLEDAACVERRRRRTPRQHQRRVDGGEEIGRASCRERGEISVGAGSLKKKTKKTRRD